MTVEEALFKCKYEIYFDCGTEDEDDLENIVIQALEKQIPQKIDNVPDGDLVAGCHRCGEINALYKPNGDRCNYCGNCGQKINWGNNEQ